MLSIFFSKIKESLLSVFPITLIVIILSFTPLIDLSLAEILTFIFSALFLIMGIGMFNMGADIAMTPMGEQVGAGLTKSKKLWLLVIVCFFMGVLITIAEPDLTVLADQVKNVLNPTLLIVTVGIGVGLFLVVSILKIVFKKNLSTVLMFFYMLLFMLSAIVIDANKSLFLPMAYDSGGVTTGPITVPFIMALGVGVASTIGGKNSSENSFGLIALCSIGPIIAVVVLSIIAQGELNYQILDYAIPTNGGEVFHVIGQKSIDVLIALGLIVLFFMLLQIFVLKLPKQRLKKMAFGVIYTFIGLVVFLSSVEVGFMPIGNKIGQQLAGSNAIVIVFAFVLGFVVVLAEPAVHVLNKQVEEITGGTVTKRSMMLALSIGVGVSIGLSVIRIIFDFSILWYVVPGYCISLGLSFFVPKMYTAIAFDSGGVASGPLTSTFILPFVIGVCSTIYPDPNQVLNLAFGMVAMVAMTPLITIQVLGFRAVVSEKVREKVVLKRILAVDDEQIINFM